MRIVLTCAASALFCIASACTASEPMDAPSTTGEADATSSGGGSSAPATTDLDLTTSGDPVPGSDTTAAMTSASPTTDSGPVPPSEPRLCSLDALDPTVDPATVLDYGDGEGQIPTEIGEALLRNCGCHYSDELPPGFVDYMSNAQPIATLADFHDTFKGFFPVGFSEMPAYEAIEERVVHSNPLPMPPHGCDVEGEDGLITMADLALFAEWLAAAAPDGATWPMR
jgi:hypothetical protein